jgi:hypothetical protein
VERPPHFAFAFVGDAPNFPQKYFKKVACFRPRKTTIQNTTTHQQSTKTSPQKTIPKPPVFSKTPEKTPLRHTGKKSQKTTSSL